MELVYLARDDVMNLVYTITVTEKVQTKHNILTNINQALMTHIVVSVCLNVIQYLEWERFSERLELGHRQI